jgi:signal transduction histidine kinase
LDKIFDPYHRDKCNGNGLGIEIVKNIAEKHGGKVRVESQVGVGSSFTVVLPALKMDAVSS